MTGHCQILSKIKPCLFTSCFDSARKNLTVPPSLWSDEMDIKAIDIFQNTHLGGTDQKSCSFWPAEALAINSC